MASHSAPSPPPKMMTSLRYNPDSTASSKTAGGLEIVDQLLLPHVIEWIPIQTIEDAFNAIKEMKIRGAPAIASLAALTMALVLRRNLAEVENATSTAYAVPDLKEEGDLVGWTKTVCDYLESSRPTAVNLGEAMNRVRFVANSTSESESRNLAQEIIKACEKVHEEDLARNREMAHLGADWLFAKTNSNGKPPKSKLRVMTVCNTGSLATSGYGTALGVITALHETGRLEKAYYTQSTPYHQGSRLTSLELSTLQIPACMICDTMVGSLMQHETIDAVIVGADRVVKNGDTANKIGTYQAAVLAKMHGVPFMVVAPVTTVDLSLETGKQIHIEQRPPVEATMARGLVLATGTQAVVQITPNGIGSGDQPWQDVYNPSFDVTPAKLISCVVTEKGVAENKGEEDAIDLSVVV